MKKIPMTLVVILLFANALVAQNLDVKFIADTLVVQAEGKFEADPDLATLTFSVFAQDKNLKQTYDQASQSMKKIADVAEKQRPPLRGGCVSLKLFQSLWSGLVQVESATQPGSAAKAAFSLERPCPMKSMAPVLAIV